VSVLSFVADNRPWLMIVPGFALGPADSGSMLTHNIARRLGKPVIHMTIERAMRPIGMSLVLSWIDCNAIRTLNVAGPRESKEPGVQVAVRDTLVSLLGGAS